MFKFLKQRRAELDARTKITIELHRQIKDAIDQNELAVSSRLHTFFTAGYILGFVREGFLALTGPIGEEAAKKHQRSICDGVLRGTLWDNVVRTLAALHLAYGMSDQQQTTRRGSRPTPAEGIKLFEDGTKIGYHDASHSETFRGNGSHNLRKYLVGELDIQALSDSIK